MKLLLFGPQGAGKGTIGNLLSKKYKISLIGAGAILRDAIKNKTPLGKIAEKYIHKGKLVPAKVIAKVVNEKIKKQKKGYMLDGFPRDLDQAKYFSEMDKIDLILVFDISKKLSIYRLSGRRTCKECGTIYNINPDGYSRPKKNGKCSCRGELTQRKDDTAKAIEERLKIYNKETKPILKKYKDKVQIIDASPPVEKILKNTVEIIKGKFNQ